MTPPACERCGVFVEAARYCPACVTWLLNERRRGLERSRARHYTAARIVVGVIFGPFVVIALILLVLKLTSRP